LDARLTTWLCIKAIVAKSREVKTGSKQTESSKEGCDSKKCCFASADDYDYENRIEHVNTL
jgi:hypothetical protein